VPLSDGAFCAQLAPVAIQSGRHCAEQILHVVHGEATTDFRYHDKGIMATIGETPPWPSCPRRRRQGAPRWLAWLGLHLWYLVGFRNRLRVFINWTCDTSTGRRDHDSSSPTPRRWSSDEGLQIRQLEVQIGTSMPPSISKTLPVM